MLVLCVLAHRLNSGRLAVVVVASYRCTLQCSYLFQVRQEDFSFPHILHNSPTLLNFLLLYWCVFHEGLFPSSGRVFSSLLHKEHSWWLASSPGYSQILSSIRGEPIFLKGGKIKSDALVHLRISTEYLSKSCITVGCPAYQSKYNRQATPVRRVKCIMNI